MRLRDRPYADTTVVYVVDGLADFVIAEIPDALRQYLLHPASLEFRSSLPGGISPAVVDEIVAGTVMSTSERLTPRELLVRGRLAPAGPIPTRIITTPDAIAVAVGHGFMDGGAIVEYISALLVGASGGTPKRDGRVPVRFPTVRGMAGAGVAAIRAFAAQRKDPVVSPIVTRSPSADDLALRTARFDTVRLDHTSVMALLSQPTNGPASPMSRVASVGIRALRRLYTAEEDLPVIVPVDVRRFVGSRRVLGNFMGVATPASLLASDWDAGVMSARNLAAVTSGTAMVANAYALVRWLVRRPRAAVKRGPSAGPGAVSVFVPMLSAPKAVAAVHWREDASRTLGIASIGVWPSGTSLSILKFDKDYYLSVWDESGYFDLAPGALVNAVESELGFTAAL